MTRMNSVLIGLFEAQIRAMASVANVEDIIIGLHNACVHGDIFDDTGEDVDLEEVFKRLDHLLALFK